jgi:hypothetical protein
VHAHQDLTSLLRGVTTVTGGPVVTPRVTAPLGRVLPYRRARGFGPAPQHADGDGWTVTLGNGALGDTLLALGAVAALYDARPGDELTYEGKRASLLGRCRLPFTTLREAGAEYVRLGSGNAHFAADPERPTAWLDLIDEDHVEVHAALPMRYYLEVEQRLGLRLPRDRAPVPSFTGNGIADPWHVVLICATSWHSRKDYGAGGFGEMARCLTDALPGPWRFTLVPGREAVPDAIPGIDIAAGLDPVECLDLFATAALVIGNDTGLTHLAALTERPDGTCPQVIGLYARHSHAKWTTGRPNHHAVATPFSSLLTLADRCPVRDRLDDAVWGGAADLRAIPAATIAAFALQLLERR